MAPIFKEKTDKILAYFFRIIFALNSSKLAREWHENRSLTTEEVDV